MKNPPYGGKPVRGADQGLRQAYSYSAEVSPLL